MRFDTIKTFDLLDIKRTLTPIIFKYKMYHLQGHKIIVTKKLKMYRLHSLK